MSGYCAHWVNDLAALPESPAGVCRFCGCTDRAACPGGCAWVDEAASVCSTCGRLVDTLYRWNLRFRAGTKSSRLRSTREAVRALRSMLTTVYA